MAENKTKPTEAAVDDYIAAIEPDRKRQDATILRSLCEDVVGEPAKMWGTSIVGCGQYHYKYDSGREGDMFLAGFAARKASLVAYIMGEISDQDELLARLGKHKMGRACLYINKLADIDMKVLRELMEKSVAAQKAKYG